MKKIGLETPRSMLAHNTIEALQALEVIGLPCIIRPSFTLGGTGGGIAYNREEYLAIVESGIDASPTDEVLIEESVLGWKEYEMEVVRDKNDNCIIVCSIENVDPMGVHTGDSITVAPALTLTDKEYQIMRDASIAVLREIGVETGGSNVQFAINPADGRMIVIEMNPRVSRSSALASKATGFPIAKVAARLAVGYTLDELENDITGGATPASFEPTIDYVVTKIPRFAFEKFPGADNRLTTSMKSVGEAMAIGRTFQESPAEGAALARDRPHRPQRDRHPRTSAGGPEDDNENAILAAISHARRRSACCTSPRPCASASASRRSTTPCKIDPWFLEQITRHRRHREARSASSACRRTPPMLRAPQGHGLLRPPPRRSRRQAGQGRARAAQAARRPPGLQAHRHQRRRVRLAHRLHVLDLRGALRRRARGRGAPLRPQEGRDPRRRPQPHRPGHRVRLLLLPRRLRPADAGYETIMVNCNPETVSTDYDTSDRLYFEPLTEEDVIEILETEKQNGTLHGVIVQFGGQTPLNLAEAVREGRRADPRHPARARSTSPRTATCSPSCINRLELTQPKNGIAYSLEQARIVAERLGYPLVIRPSYVLGGRAMAIVHSPSEFERYVQDTLTGAGAARHPDPLPQRQDRPDQLGPLRQPAAVRRLSAAAPSRSTSIASATARTSSSAASWSTSRKPASTRATAPARCRRSTSRAEVIAELKRQTTELALALKVGGLMNVQYALKDGIIYILEVNPRASRTVPFVAKVIGQPIAKIASRIMAGESLASFNLVEKKLNHIAVKEAVFPFNRFPGVDTVLGPEMKSTGEVIGLDTDYADGLRQVAARRRLQGAARGHGVHLGARRRQAADPRGHARHLEAAGFKIVATSGTQRYLVENGIAATKVNKVLEGRPHIVDSMKNGGVQLVINTTDGAKSISDSRDIRRTALMGKIPYYTTIPGAVAAVEGIIAYRDGNLTVRPLQDYFAA